MEGGPYPSSIFYFINQKIIGRGTTIPLIPLLVVLLP